jgi:hypothetical protein
MDSSFTMLRRGTIYLENGNIAAVTQSGEVVPAGFEAVNTIDTHSTVFPGFIELHNHLAYNIIRLWSVPKKCGNRGQWQASVDYHNVASGPMRNAGDAGLPDPLGPIAAGVDPAHGTSFAPKPSQWGFPTPTSNRLGFRR